MSAIWTDRGHNYSSNKKNKQHFGLTSNQLQAGSPFLAAEDALQEIARCDKITIMWYDGDSSSVFEGLAMMGLKSRSSSRCSMGRNGILLKIMSFFQFLSCIQSITISPRFKELLKKTGLKVTFLINDFWVKYS